MTGSNDATVRLWDISSGSARPLGAFVDHEDWVRSVEPVPWPGRDHPLVASASGDGTVRIWDPARLDEPEIVRLHVHRAPVRSIRTVSFPGVPVPVLLTAAADRTVRVINPYSSPETVSVALVNDDIVRDAVAIVGENGAGSRIATTDGCDVRVWELGGTGPSSIRLSGHTDWVRGLAVLRTGDVVRVCSVSNDGTLRVWNPVIYGRCLVGRGHSDWVWDVAVARLDGSAVILTTSADASLRIWRIAADALVPVATVPLAAAGLSLHVRGDRVVVTTSRGFVVVRLRQVPA